MHCSRSPLVVVVVIAPSLFVVPLVQYAHTCRTFHPTNHCQLCANRKLGTMYDLDRGRLWLWLWWSLTPSILFQLEQITVSHIGTIL